MEQVTLVVEPDFTTSGGWQLTLSKPLLNSARWNRRTRKLCSSDLQRLLPGNDFTYDGGLIIRTFLGTGRIPITVLVDPETPNVILIERVGGVDAISQEIEFRSHVAALDVAFSCQRMLSIQVRYIEKAAR